ncbi:MAG: ribonuclease R [Pseudomonadota bacterium]
MSPPKKKNSKRQNREPGDEQITPGAIIDALQRAAVPCTVKILAQHMKLRGKTSLKGLESELRQLVRSGKLVKSRANRYGLAAKMDVVAGSVLAHPNGYAFVKPDDGGEDIYVNRRDALRVLHLDRVQISITGIDHKGRRKGKVIEILERANHEVVGRYFKESGVGFVVPENRKINQDILLTGDRGLAKNGQIVVARIDKQPDGHSQPLGSIIEVLGDHLSPGMEIEIAVRSHQLPHEWPDQVVEELEAIPNEISNELETLGQGERKDLRELPFVTIDGEDARDFDDAVYCKKRKNGYTLYVAIADVSHYIKMGSALDAEAYNRGTSVYFPSSVIPMLPEELSNGICSLMPSVDRLVLVCEMAFDERGVRKRARFYDAVIHSHARLTYTQVSAWLDGDEAAFNELDAENFEPEVIGPLWEIYQHFERTRAARGALEVETVEPLFIFNEQRKISAIESRERNDAHKIIEECMIAANVAAAEYLSDSDYAAIYRNHDKPDSEKLEALRQFLVDLGLPAKFSEPPTAESVASVLTLARERADRVMIETMILRSLKLAVYANENTGHFGLALSSYCHFTSPIRRYPDLVIHRALKNRRRRKRATPITLADLAETADQCSFTERRAEEASRDVTAWLKCEYMQDKVGEDFNGYVSGVTNFGVFVTLTDIFVEGLVHVTALPQDYYHYDPIRHTLSGEKTRREYRIGDELEVKVLSVSLAERKIDFELTGNAP